MRQRVRWQSAGALAILVCTAGATLAWTGSAGASRQGRAASYDRAKAGAAITSYLQTNPLAPDAVPDGAAPEATRRPQSVEPPTPCYRSIFSDPAEGSPLDVKDYGTALDCSAGKWTFALDTFDTWPDSGLRFVDYFLDTDEDPATGCGGFDFVLSSIYETQSQQLLVGLFRTPTGCPTPILVSDSGAAVVRSAGGRNISLSVLQSALGSPTGFFWFGAIQGSSNDSVVDEMPNDGNVHGETGFTGDGCDFLPFSAPAGSFAVVDDPGAAAAALRGAGQPGVLSLGQESRVVRFAGDPWQAAGALAAQGITARVGAERPRQLMATPNDPDFSKQWNLPAVRAPQAWDHTKGSSEIIVGVVDSGIDGTHPDLKDKLVDGFDATTGAPIPKDINSDTEGHGTSVAGVIAAATDNKDELASVGWNTRVMPIRTGDAISFNSAVIAGINFASSRGLPIINISLGGNCPDPDEASAIKNAHDKGMLIVAAAGNEAEDGDRISYPAAYPNVISVGATGFDGTRARYSNFGNWVDIVAPGGSADGVDAHNILALQRGGGTRPVAGTSFSSPTVAAAAALVLAVERTVQGAGVQAITPDQTASVLLDTAKDVGPSGKDQFFGVGILDVEAAVIRAAEPPPTTTTTTAPTTTTTAPPATTRSTVEPIRTIQNIVATTPVAQPQAKTPSFVG